MTVDHKARSLAEPEMPTGGDPGKLGVCTRPVASVRTSREAAPTAISITKPTEVTALGTEFGQLVAPSA